LTNLSSELIQNTIAEIVRKVETCIDKMKTNPEPITVVLVEGGGIILPTNHYSQLAGVSQIIRPQHFQFANAIGAAIAQVSGKLDRVFSLEHQTRTEVLNTAKRLAVADAIKAGAKPDTMQVVDIDEIHLAYLPGNAVRIKIKTCRSLLI
jgi:hypothetical protein